MSFIINPYRYATNDPNFANVVALLHLNGANNSIVFTDETGRTWDRANTTTIGTAQSVFGGASLDLNGSNEAIFTNDAAALEVTNQDWTIEFRVRFDSPLQTTSAHMASKYTTSGNQRSWLVVKQSSASSHNLAFVYSTDGTATTTLTTAWNPNADTWYAIAICRNGSDILFFIDGVLVSTQNIGTASLFNGSATLGIGASGVGISSATNPVDGWIDEFRFTVGVCRYTATYTPAASEFPNS